MVVIAYRQFAQTFLRSMAIKKVPVTTAIKFMRAEGISFRYAEMLRTYRSYAKVAKVTDAYKYIPKKYRIPENLFGEIPYQTKDYLYDALFKTRDRQTGVVKVFPARISSDFHLSQTSIERECRLNSDVLEENYGVDIIDFEVTAAFRKRD